MNKNLSPDNEPQAKRGRGGGELLLWKGYASDFNQPDHSWSGRSFPCSPDSSVACHFGSFQRSGPGAGFYCGGEPGEALFYSPAKQRHYSALDGG